MGQTTSPLRYPGGKIRLSNFIEQIIVDNDLLGGAYVEAYAGGAGIAWQLLFDNYINNIYINDIDHSIFAFWSSVFNYTEELCKLIQDTQVTIDEWHRQKKVQTGSDVSILNLGFSTFFLNRTNRSGIILGGVIGGKKQDGIYKIDARYNKKKLIARVQKIASYKSKVKLYNQDALAFIKHLAPSLPEKTLFYLDPPYYKKGSALYLHHYAHNDHIEVANLIRNIKCKWIVTYDNAPEISEIYADYENILYNLSYSAADKYNGHEIIFFSPGLIVNKKEPLTIKKSKSIKSSKEQLMII